MLKRSKILLLTVILMMLSSLTCTIGGIVEPALPTKGVETLQVNLPTFTPQPSLTPPPTLPHSTPTPTLNPTATTEGSLVKILVYEDTGDIGPWVKEVLDKLGLEYTYVTGSGNLLEQLQSDTKWNLIIIAAETKSSIQGVIWDLLSKKVNFENASLIVETWSIHLISEGKIKPFLVSCGVELEKNLGQAVPVYILDAQSPVFTEPNKDFTLERPVPYWSSEAVDLLKLIPNSYAKILAGNDPKESTSGGMITSCFQGRVILQTFLNHDYPKAAIVALWENYLTFMLRRYK